MNLSTLADSVIDWAYNNGYVSQLATLATNTTAIRSLILTASSAAAAHGLIKGSPSESIISIAVVVSVSALNSFVTYARNKHDKEVQVAAGMPTSQQDSFVGKETVAAVTALATK